MKFADYIAEQRLDPEYRDAERRLWFVLLLDDIWFHIWLWITWPWREWKARRFIKGKR